MQSGSNAAEKYPESDEPARRRWSQFVHFRRIMCPAGHHLKHDQDFNESGYIRCKHWIASESRECGHWVFVFAVRGGGIVEVELFGPEEKDRLRELSTPTEVLEYLGIFDEPRPQPAPYISAPRTAARAPDRHHGRR